MHLLDSNILIYAGQPGNEFLDAWLTAEGTGVSAISIPEVLGFTGGSLRNDSQKQRRCSARLFVSLGTMKVISIDEARTQLDSVCDQVLAGEVIRLRNRTGALVELTPVGIAQAPPPLDAEKLAECYEDADWASFENHCAKASD